MKLAPDVIQALHAELVGPYDLDAEAPAEAEFEADHAASTDPSERRGS